MTFGLLPLTINKAHNEWMKRPAKQTLTALTTSNSASSSAPITTALRLDTKSLDFRIEVLVAFATWLAITTITIWHLVIDDTVSNAATSYVALLFVAFMVSFLLSTSETIHPEKSVRQWHLLGQICVIFALYFSLEIKYVPILATIWSTQLPQYFSLRHSIMLSGLASVVIYLSFHYYWHYDSAMMSAFVYWMFNIFGVMTMHRAILADKAKEQANQLNRELIATQSLLTEATRQSERLRISRNIHDVVGHHLTALTINLQVASHLAEGQAKEAIDQSWSVAKLLLGDVRTAVSEIRDMSAIDLNGALQRLFDNIPRLQIDCTIDPQIKITEVSLAEMLLRSVQEALTNSLKHGHSKQVWIDLSLQGTQLLLHIKDNGYRDKGLIEAGNGLTGMAERVAALGGEFEYQANAPYFSIKIKVAIKHEG